MRFASLTRYLLPVISIAASAQLAYSQNNLAPGIPVERKIAAGQTHTYNIRLEEDQYVRLVVDQKGIDLEIRVLDSNGHLIGDFDNPNAAGGPESVSFIAESSGTFTIELLPLDEFRNPAPGSYEIRFLELRNVTDQELRSGKTQLALRYKGVALLNEVIAELPAVRSPVMRAGFELDLARLYWSFDDKVASKLLSHAADLIREPLQSISSFDSDMDRNLLQLRKRIVEQMAKREPEAALNFLRTTRSPKITRYVGYEETEQELSISAKLAPLNPKAALQIAEEHLKHGLSTKLLTTVRALQEKNPELAAALAHEILARLANQPLIAMPSNAYMASSLVQLVRNSGTPSVKYPGPERKLISDAELRGLLQRMVSEVMAFSPPETGAYSYQKTTAESLIATLKQWSGGMQVVTPELLAAMEKRLASKTSVTIVNGNEFVISNIDIQDHDEAMQTFHRLAVHESIGKRNFADAFQHLDMLPAEYRVELIADIVREIGPGLKKSTASMFLERARRMLPDSSRAANLDEAETLLAFVTPYSLLDSNRGFEIVEPLIEQFSELSIAAMTMNGFSNIYYIDGDFVTTNPNFLAEMATKLAIALGQLAPANFQRAKSDADRLRPPSARIKVKLEIARRAITGTDNDETVD